MKKTVMIAAFAAMIGLAACSNNNAPEQTEKQQDSVDQVVEKKDSLSVDAMMKADSIRDAFVKDSLAKVQLADSLAKLKKK